jgi:hypothetical protein
MQMTGFSTPQQKWYEKHGGEFPTLCVATTVSGGREALNESTLINHLEGGIPVYVIGWEEHLMYNGAGNRYYEASGILYRLEDGKYVQLAPLHNGNHTILTSSSTSLLKEGLEEIKRREWRQASSEVERGAQVAQSEYAEDRQAYLTDHPDKADWKQRADNACLSSDMYFDEDDGARMKKCSDRPWKPQQSEEAKAKAVKTLSSSKPQLSAASRPDGDIVASLHSEKQDTLPLVTKTAYMIKREGKYFIEGRLDGLLPNDVVLFSDSTCIVDPNIHAPGWDYVSVCRGQVWEGWLKRRSGDVYWIGWKEGADFTTSVR